MSGEREYEFDAKSVDKAIEKACERLQIPEDQLKYDVISYGSTGIFGLVGSKKARIRVTAPAGDTPPPVAGQGAANSKAADTAKDLEHDVQALVDETFERPAAVEKKSEHIPETVVDRGQEALRKIVDAITDDAQLRVEQKAGQLSFSIEGGNSAVLIGKRGQTLEAIEYLVEKVVNQHSNQRIRVQVDVQGYLAKRKGSLKKMAARLAEKAKKTGKPMTLGQMNARDRRIVHMALKADQAVKTQSVGTGLLRKLVILPKASDRKGKKAATGKRSGRSKSTE